MFEGCAYTSLTGVFSIPSLCEFDTVGTPADGTTCPGCDFSFDTINTLTSGSCTSSAELVIGYTGSAGEVALYFLGSDLGPFPATLTPGVGYDNLYFSGPSVSGYTYTGTFNLY